MQCENKKLTSPPGNLAARKTKHVVADRRYSVGKINCLIKDMKTEKNYPVGQPGIPWGGGEKRQWRQMQKVKRSYQQEVVAQITSLRRTYRTVRFGALPYDVDKYPLFVLLSPDWDSCKPTALITGGVHGYETSGVHGALRFLETEAPRYFPILNIVVAPCISPWGYETINRWNPNTIDPNRAFYPDTPAAEAGLFMAYLASLDATIIVHIDLHETTDTDNSEFRPALAARDGTMQDNWDIPDGFYLVGDTEKPTPDFQHSIITAVEKVTHIAPPDANGNIIGESLQQKGVIHYTKNKLGLCGGVTDAPYVATTEVYPDSARADAENCIQAQVAAITGALGYVSVDRP